MSNPDKCESDLIKTDLIRQLNYWGERYRRLQNDHAPLKEMMREAASALQSQKAENERLKEALELAEAELSDFADAFWGDNEERKQQDPTLSVIRSVLSELASASLGKDQAQSEASREGAPPRLRWEYARGDTFREMQENCRNSDLYKHGDTVLVWANEGDLLMVNIDLPKSEASRHVVPPGYALVPREPTEKMLAAGGYHKPGTDGAGIVYRAMIAAAPQQGGE